MPQSRSRRRLSQATKGYHLHSHPAHAAGGGNVARRLIPGRAGCSPLRALRRAAQLRGASAIHPHSGSSARRRKSRARKCARRRTNRRVRRADDPLGGASRCEAAGAREATAEPRAGRRQRRPLFDSRHLRSIGDASGTWYRPRGTPSVRVWPGQRGGCDADSTPSAAPYLTDAVTARRRSPSDGLVVG